MPHINRLPPAVFALILLSVGWSPAPAQTFSPMPGAATGIVTEDPSWIRSKLDEELGLRGSGPAQQVLRITKGKDYDKLPPNFQWDTPPTPLSVPYPVYPFELLKNKVAGKIRAYFIIGPNGRVLKAELDEAATPEFGLAVRAMLDSFRFNPPKKKDGTPAYANVGIEYDFQPKGRSDVPVAAEARLILQDLEKKPAKILGLHDLDVPLKPLVRTPPTYPTALQATMPAGNAEVEFFVDTTGRVQLPHIKASSAPEFGYAAMQAVAAWRFEAPLKGGKTVVVRVTVPIGFEGRKVADVSKP